MLGAPATGGRAHVDQPTRHPSQRGRTGRHAVLRAGQPVTHHQARRRPTHRRRRRSRTSSSTHRRTASPTVDRHRHRPTPGPDRRGAHQSDSRPFSPTCPPRWSNSRLPTTLNARDQPPAEVSDQRVSGLTGAVQERGSLVDHHAKGAQCEQRLGDRLATQPGHAADRGWNTTTPHREVLVEYLAEPIDYLPAEPRAPPRLLRPPCAGLPRPMPESLVVAERHPIHRASVCLLVSGDHPATPKTRRRPSLPRRPLLFEL